MIFVPTLIIRIAKNQIILAQEATFRLNKVYKPPALPREHRLQKKDSPSQFFQHKDTYDRRSDMTLFRGFLHV
jgi:hypothetical protein